MRILGLLLCVPLLAHCTSSVGGGDPTVTDAAADAALPQDGAADSGRAVDAAAPDAGSSQPDAAAADAAPFDADLLDADLLDADLLDAEPVDSGPSGPNVDRSNPQLYRYTFTAADADPAATRALGTELGVLDTRVAPIGQLVVYLHGAGAPTNCGAGGHADFLAAHGFHVVMPCYVSDYGVGNCGNDIGGCRLEAFEGVDHSAVIDIAPADAIEPRVVKMLERLATLNPEGDWSYFLNQGQPRWDAIVISGISHGASSAGLIGDYRSVARVVMLSGPLDTGQDWLALPALTPRDRYYGFTHTADGQHPGHLAAFETMGLPGAPVSVEDVAAPYNSSHRLITSAATNDGHSSTQLGGASPEGADNHYLFEPVWEVLYGP